MEETLGKRIAFHRKRLGLTQDRLAELLGVTAQAVSTWENDQSCPDIAMLPKLSEVFDISTDALLGIQRKEVSSTETVPENAAPHQEPVTDTPKHSKWKALTSPGAAFAFWLFLTGLVAVIQAFQLVRCDLADVAIACGIFSFGLFGFFRSFSVLRLGCAVAGGIFVLNLITETGLADIDWYIPLAAGIALLGLDLLIGTIRNSKHENPNERYPGHMTNISSKNYCSYDGERFECATCFGSGDRLIQLPRLSGGKGELSFGELIIDLSGCAEIADGCSVGLDCSFGSLEILVPRKYRVEAATSSAFGAVDVKGAPDPSADITIYLNCKVSFGEITIRHI